MDNDDHMVKLRFDHSRCKNLTTALKVKDIPNAKSTLKVTEIPDAFIIKFIISKRGRKIELAKILHDSYLV